MREGLPYSEAIRPRQANFPEDAKARRLRRSALAIMVRRALGRRQAVRQRILIPPYGGSNPPAPARNCHGRDSSRAGGRRFPAFCETHPHVPAPVAPRLRTALLSLRQAGELETLPQPANELLVVVAPPDQRARDMEGVHGQKALKAILSRGHHRGLRHSDPARAQRGSRPVSNPSLVEIRAPSIARMRLPGSSLLSPRCGDPRRLQRHPSFFRQMSVGQGPRTWLRR